MKQVRFQINVIVRTPAEFNSGHIENAKIYNIWRFTIRSTIAALGVNQKTVLVYLVQVPGAECR